MASNSETGHAKNVANFGSLISYADGYGAVYNPSKPSIILSALSNQFDLANAALANVNSAMAVYSKAIAAREVAFNPIGKLITRVFNFIKASDTPPEVDDQVHSLVRKIQGVRATPKKNDEEKAALEADGKAPKEISSAQMSFDSRIENIDKLVKLLANIPQYAPNEEELKALFGATSPQYKQVSSLKFTNPR